MMYSLTPSPFRSTITPRTALESSYSSASRLSRISVGTLITDTSRRVSIQRAGAAVCADVANQIARSDTAPQQELMCICNPLFLSWYGGHREDTAHFPGELPRTNEN